MKINHTQAFNVMLSLFEKFEGLPPSNQDNEWLSVDKYAANLVMSGWTRKDIYNLVRDIDNRHSNSMAEECSDSISNYLTGLVGDVAAECIVRLPGENCDLAEHARYVRSRVWW
jgi:hypothetical protein